MTKNQIEYAKLLETQRSNLANEGLTRVRDRGNLSLGYRNLEESHRHNVAEESNKARSLDETIRANVVKERETQRSNLAKEAETNRSNVARETETRRAALRSEDLRSRELTESQRHNAATESEARRSNVARESENVRSNLARELETTRSNVSRETETHRSNTANERLGVGSLIEKTISNWRSARETKRSNLAKEKNERQKAEAASLQAGAAAARTVMDGVGTVFKTVTQAVSLLG